MCAVIREDDIFNVGANYLKGVLLNDHNVSAVVDIRG
ncbi:hypothetical protein AGR1A_Lc40076 [Agrobacterium fabacearum CFBP 5771]|nr:hypothetical protein AGR1A_Lc40076 [Agrobacterium fabacearum CFBP 5771]